MSTASEIARFIDDIDRRCRAVLVAPDLYEAASDLWSFGLGSTPRQQQPVRDWSKGLWLIWASLTDGFDSPGSTPETRAWAVDGMRRAAREWLGLPRHDHDARRRYLDRWVYDECGYVRPER